MKKWVVLCLFVVFLLSLSVFAQEWSWDENPQQGVQDIQDLSQARGLKVMWWNVQAGILNSTLKGTASVGPLEQNLNTLIESDAAPDVILLGEFVLNAPGIDSGFLRKLAVEYPFMAVRSYSEDATQTLIAVYSRVPFKETRSVALDWANDEVYRRAWSERFPEPTKMFKRAYLNLEFQTPAGPVQIIPIHLLDPWQLLMEFGGRVAGPVLTAQGIILGEWTPIAYQARNLRTELCKDFGKKMDRKPLLMMGDFNSIKTSYAYRVVNDYLHEAFTLAPASFPAASDPKRQSNVFRYWHPKIDHAFGNEWVNFEEAKILPFRGSDHYPVYSVIQVTQPRR